MGAIFIYILTPKGGLRRVLTKNYGSISLVRAAVGAVRPARSGFPTDLMT